MDLCTDIKIPLETSCGELVFLTLSSDVGGVGLPIVAVEPQDLSSEAGFVEVV